MKDPTKEQNEIHFKAVAAFLPAKLRKKVGIRRRSLVIEGVCSVRLDRQWSDRPTYMKVNFEWKYSERIRCFRQHKDEKYGYKKIAEHITDVVAERAATEKRQRKGERTAKRRIAALEEQFRSNPLLSALNLEFDTKPSHQTEEGRVDVDVTPVNTCEQDYMSASVAFDGQSFTGDVNFEGLSVEQFTALMVVLRADQLNLLEMLSLADDSILGPIINKLSEEGGKTKHE